MIDKSLELLTEEELKLNKRFEECKTMEELKALEKEINLLYENHANVQQYKQINMSLEEFKKKYDLVDIRDLKAIQQLDRVYTDLSIYNKFGYFTEDFKKWNYEFHQYVRKSVLSTLTAPHGVFSIGSIGSLIYTIYNVLGIKCLLIESFSFPTFVYTSVSIPTVDTSKSPSAIWQAPQNNLADQGKYIAMKQMYYNGLRIGYDKQTHKYNILNKQGVALSKVPLTNVKIFKQPFGSYYTIAHVNVKGQLWAMDVKGRFYDMGKKWNDYYLSKNESFKHKISHIITETINRFIINNCIKIQNKKCI